VLLMVPGDYFSRPEKYVEHAEWISLWRRALRVEYDPSVHVQAPKPKRAAKRNGTPSAALMDAARETLKYALKPEDMTSDRAWFKEVTRQSYKLRFIASGGILKDVLREDQETNADLLLPGDGEADESPRLYFDWHRPVRRYKRRGGTLQ